MIEKKIISLIKSLYPNNSRILLHEPTFISNESFLLNDCLNKGFVSSAGEYLNKLKKEISSITKSKYVALTSSGTAALHLSLLANNIGHNNEVITQPFSFVATINSIIYTGAKPIFVDIDEDDLGLSPEKLNEFLKKNTYINKSGLCINKSTKNEIKSVISCDLLGSAAKQNQIKKICKKFNLIYISDSSEALGVKYSNNIHAGSESDLSVLSFNGNKIITTGNGGAVYSNNKKIIDKINHLASTSKVDHEYEFIHNQLGYNYRMSNINAALGFAQIKNLKKIIRIKKEINQRYKDFFSNTKYRIFEYKKNIKSNYWLNSLIVNSKKTKLNTINILLKNNIMVRPTWFPLCDLNYCKSYQRFYVENTYKAYDTMISLPSGITNVT